jgi:hypothetical protein
MAPKIQLHYDLASSFRDRIATASAGTLSSTRARSGRNLVNAGWETPESMRSTGLGIMRGTQSIYGICVERREDSAVSAVLWTYSLTAGQF